MEKRQNNNSKSGRSKKKTRLRTSQDVYNRIMWDTGRYGDPASFTLGYLDRFDGMMELPLDEFVPIDKGGDIAYHRIYYFRQGDVVMWDRNRRIDRIFGSGETSAADATTTTTTTTSSDDGSGSASSGEEDATSAAPVSEPVAVPKPAPKQQATMPKMRSCGVLLFTEVAGSRYFLLMKHANRYDLPKGHVEAGETDLQCALREVREETGFQADAFRLDSRFVYTETYYPVYRRLGGKTVEKTLCVFLGHLLPADADAADAAVARDPATGFPVVRRTEHGAHEWIKWNPPHRIQKNTIDPLLKAVNEHFLLLKDEARARAASGETNGDNEAEANEDGDDDYDEDEDEEVDVDINLLTSASAVAEVGTVERTEEKEKLERERAEKTERERLEREQKTRRRTDYNARKARRQRNAMVAGGGYALLDKVRDESGRGGRVGIYAESDIQFDEAALNAQAKLILKRNDRATRNLDPRVRAAPGVAVNLDQDGDGADDDDDDVLSDEEAAQYVASRRSAPGVGLGEFMDLAGRPATSAVEDFHEDGDGGALQGEEAEEEVPWTCGQCTYVNRPTFLCCEICNTERRP